MEIRLHRIGMIEDSEIKLDGLTVITGENNSGKTTIGKALYALVDTVSDLPKKAKADRDTYILNELSKLVENSSLFRAFFIINRIRENKNNEYPALFTLSSRSVGRDYRNDISDPEAFAYQVKDELEAFLHSLQAYPKLSNQWLKEFLSLYPSMPMETTQRVAKRNTVEIITQTVRAQVKQLQTLFENINGDPLLTHYVKDGLNRTLKEEFSDQIQPVRDTKTASSICLSGNDFPLFEVNLKDNGIIDYTFHDFPLQKTYFVDNPVVLDQNFSQLMSVYRQSVLAEIDLDSYLNPKRIRSHMARLSAILRGGEEINFTKQRVLDEKLAPVKAKINAVVPGTFDFSGADEFYVSPEGDKLRLTNLAAGSKMFSIMKILLEKGLLDENSMLILDEPEVHLHPKWQNHFAEVIVLLVKELHINVLLTTHSSNFMLALDAYVRKYEIRELANFYQARRLESGLVTHDCVTNRMEVIYQDFVKPLAEMDVLRDKYADDEEDSDDAEEWEDERGEGGDEDA